LFTCRIQLNAIIFGNRSAITLLYNAWEITGTQIVDKYWNVTLSALCLQSTFLKMTTHLRPPYYGFCSFRNRLMLVTSKQRVGQLVTKRWSPRNRLKIRCWIPFN